MHHEAYIRVGSFIVVFMVLALWEVRAPRRTLTASKGRRWFSNLALLLMNPLSVRLLFPVLPVGMAVLAAERHWGLLNNIHAPYFLAVAVGVVSLDLVVYLQHVLTHAIPTLWRLHMVHHADLDIDLTTGLRFHPVEIIISMILKIAAVAALGPPVLAVLVFEVLLNATSVFNHSNIRIPFWADRILRWFVVTPDMHRVHHSVIIRETNSNFGFNLPWWDRLLGTYRDQPAKGHEGMTIGLSQFRDPARLTLKWLLALPVVGDPGPQPINRH